MLGSKRRSLFKALFLQHYVVLKVARTSTMWLSGCLSMIQTTYFRNESEVHRHQAKDFVLRKITY